jgi:hypothetical protein
MKSNTIYTLTIASIVVLLLGSVVVIPLTTQDTVTFTVTDKDRVTERNGESITSRYLIFTETETFQNADSLIFFKFNSSDVYGQIKKGETYTAEVYGFRIPFLSAYRNIKSIEKK